MEYKVRGTYRYHNENPKGKRTGDCVARAISLALNQSWETTIREMTELGIQHGYTFSDKRNIERYLKSKGWIKAKQPRHIDNTKYTGEQFCLYIARKGERYIANIGTRHITAIIDKQIYDTWYCGRGRIGNYWYKEK